MSGHGLVKTYPRFEHEARFGIICSPECNIQCSSNGTLALCGALSDILVWNIKTCIVVNTLKSNDGDVRELSCRPSSTETDTHVAAGYSDGMIRIWDYSRGNLLVRLNGHSKGITSLSFSADGGLLASGSQDTDIIVWDVVSETGKFRLRGHKDAVTCLRFLSREGRDDLLVSASKDTLMKVWDLETQHCIQTCVGHRCEVWSMDISPGGDRLVTGSSDNQLRLWEVGNGEVASEEAAADSNAANNILKLIGGIVRHSKGRATTVRYSADGRIIVTQGTGKEIEVFSVFDSSEKKKRIKRRERRQKERLQKRKQQEQDASQSTFPTASAQDEIGALARIRYPYKIRSLALSLPQTDSKGLSSLSMVTAMQNNRVEARHLQYDKLKTWKQESRKEKKKNSKKKKKRSVEVDDESELYEVSHELDMPGHRSGVRAVAMSKDGSLIATTSQSTLKIWNAASHQCIRTMDCKFGLCVIFVPGDEHVVVGTKEGTLALYDLSSSSCIEELDSDSGGHRGSVWSIVGRPDGRGYASGGADKAVKFFDFDLKTTEEKQRKSKKNDGSKVARVGESREAGKSQVLTQTHTRTLNMNDEVLCVRYNHTRKPEEVLLCVALLDATVKIFFDDTLKFFLSLYGHKLPVMAIDISSDNSLVLTASADKNVKIWGLDYGDCHKSMFAHADSVMCARWIPNTHYFFTVGKDATIKYWDGDRFELILELNGHKAEIWAIDISSDGNTFATVSNDRSIQLWSRTDEMVFLDEEKERRLEEHFDAQESDGRIRNQAGTITAGGQGDEATVESASASRRTLETTKGAERLIYALEMVNHEEKRVQSAIDSGKTASPNPLMLGKTTLQYMLQAISSIPSNELEQALLVLPFHLVEELFGWLSRLMDAGVGSEIVAKSCLLLIRIYQKTISYNRSIQQPLRGLQRSMHRSIRSMHDQIGFNMAALKLLDRKLDESSSQSVVTL